MDPRTAGMLAERERRAAAVPPPLRGVAQVARTAAGGVKRHKLVAWVALGALVVSGLVAYDWVITKPEQLREQAILDARATERVNADAATRQAGLDQRLLTIKVDADERWAKACKASRQRLAGCSLPERLVDEIDRQESAARNACLKQFSLTMQ